jgi:hypothetical protein
MYEEDSEDNDVPLRGLAFLFADRSQGPEVIRAAKTTLIHEEMLNMHAIKEGAAAGGGGGGGGGAMTRSVSRGTSAVGDRLSTVYYY